MDKQLNQNKDLKSQTETLSKSEIDFEKINKAYDSEPWWYDVRGFLILKFAYRSSLISQLRLFSKNMGPQHLEVAIGSGSLFDLILKWRKLTRQPQAQNITAFDYAERMLAGAYRKFKNMKNIKLTLADAAAMPFANDSFDSVNVANAIHCLPEIERSLAEIHRVLKPKGLFAANVLLEPKGQTLMDKISRRINTWGIRKGILHRPYSEAEVEELLENAGFVLKYKNIKGNCFDFVAEKIQTA